VFDAAVAAGGCPLHYSLHPRLFPRCYWGASPPCPTARTSTFWRICGHESGAYEGYLRPLLWVAPIRCAPTGGQHSRPWHTGRRFVTPIWWAHSGDSGRVYVQAAMLAGLYFSTSDKPESSCSSYPSQPPDVARQQRREQNPVFLLLGRCDGHDYSDFSRGHAR